MVHGHQSIPAPSRASLSMSSATATRRAAPHPPAARRERRGRGKNERENPSSRGGGECLAGPVAVPAHGGCEAKPPEADEEGKGASRKVSAFSFRRPHQCHTALLSE
ncbi:hypothetical protein PVAP13_5NG612901 [Panicum virgatum]|uniref:Uncharacterized protein n=1 Tax=Panicum virgatum TaxID=38727 RepID=A0A8T0S4R7_PANVG|nr:hypothetical protein PVAP13_5NG612901 [Panicum virgatum]